MLYVLWHFNKHCKCDVICVVVLQQTLTTWCYVCCGTSANMEAMERDFECRNESMKTEYEQEISRLKQQNYVLTAKVSKWYLRMRVWMCECILVCLCVCMHACVRACVRACMRVCVCWCVSVCMHMCVSVYVYVHAKVCMCAYVVYKHACTIHMLASTVVCFEAKLWCYKIYILYIKIYRCIKIYII